VTFRTGVARLTSAVVAVLFAAGLAGCGSSAGSGALSPTVGSVETTAVAPALALTVNADGTEVSYEGVAGVTALVQLQTLDPVVEMTGEGEMAFVTGINGRVADESKNEFWAFYINDESAQVGAGTYVMEDGDIITWKLETF
jgi:hypothetical protein